MTRRPLLFILRSAIATWPTCCVDPVGLTEADSDPVQSSLPASFRVVLDSSVYIASGAGLLTLSTAKQRASVWRHSYFQTRLRLEMR